MLCGQRTACSLRLGATADTEEVTILMTWAADALLTSEHKDHAIFVSRHTVRSGIERVILLCSQKHCPPDCTADCTSIKRSVDNARCALAKRLV